MKYLGYLMLAICLCSCASTSCYPGGEAVKARKQTDSLSFSLFAYYQNPSLDFYSYFTYWPDGFEVSDKYLRKAKLPKAYRSYLADSLNGKQLLYTAVKTFYSSDYAECYFIATITRPLDDPDLSQLTDMRDHPEIRSDDIQFFHLFNGKKALFFHYTVLKDNKALFNVLSCHTIWQGNRIVSISAINSCKKKFYAYAFQNDADHFFQTIPVVAE